MRQPANDEYRISISIAVPSDERYDIVVQGTAFASLESILQEGRSLLVDLFQGITHTTTTQENPK